MKPLKARSIVTLMSASVAAMAEVFFWGGDKVIAKIEAERSASNESLPIVCTSNRRCQQSGSGVQRSRTFELIGRTIHQIYYQPTT